MQLSRNFIENSGTLFEIVRVLVEKHKPIISDWKEHLRCDRVFRKNGMLYFCRTIEDVEAEIIPDKKDAIIKYEEANNTKI